MPIIISGQHFQVSDLETARCIAGQGELPFKVDAGYDVNTVDLRSNNAFATLDYSEIPPLVFVGQTVHFDALKLTKLRDLRDPSSGSTAQAPIQARAFNCPHCAAPLTLHSLAIESIACASCGSIIGIDNENIQLLARAAQALREIPCLPLGSTGSVRGIVWEVIGFLRRKSTSEDIDYFWSEYLLFNAQQGFAWLTEYQGHWNFVRALANPPSVGRRQRAFKYEGEEFKLFSRSPAEVTYVLGEFYWRVSVGETATVDDYIHPPRMLSREVTEKEVIWSQGDYLEAEELRTAFRIAVPALPQSGVFANQPNPLAERYRGICRLFWTFALLATMVQLFFFFFLASHLVLKQSLVFSAQTEEASKMTQEFTLKSRARALLVRHKTDVDNNWLSLTTTLIEKNTGEAHQGVQEISYYKGVDDGESWSEGSTSDDIVFKGIPAGSYYLSVEAELGPDKRAAVLDTLEVIRNPAGWSNYLLVLIFLALFPLFSRGRRNSFEARRWNESAIESHSEGNNDD